MKLEPNGNWELSSVKDSVSQKGSSVPSHMKPAKKKFRSDEWNVSLFANSAQEEDSSAVPIGKTDAEVVQEQKSDQHQSINKDFFR
jgi:hypothetical protein